MAPGPVWTGAENLASTGIRSPDRPARSQSLYRLSYTAHTFVICQINMQFQLLKPFCRKYSLLGQKKNALIVVEHGVIYCQPLCCILNHVTLLIWFVDHDFLRIRIRPIYAMVSDLFSVLLLIILGLFQQFSIWYVSQI